MNVEQLVDIDCGSNAWQAVISTQTVLQGPQLLMGDGLSNRDSVQRESTAKYHFDQIQRGIAQ